MILLMNFLVAGHGMVKRMIKFFECDPSEEDLDQIRLSIVRLLFDKDLTLDSGVFLHELDGSKTMKIVMKPKIKKEFGY